MICYLALKKEILPLAPPWMKLEDKHYAKQDKPDTERKRPMISVLCGILKSQIHRSNSLFCTTIELNSSKLSNHL